MNEKNAVSTSFRQVEVFAPEVSCDAHEAFQEECEACWDVAEAIYEQEAESSSSDGSWSDDDEHVGWSLGAGQAVGH